MPHLLPATLEALLRATDAGARDRAWEAFLLEHSGLVIHVIRRTTKDHDVIMDRYTFVIDMLRRDECKRLRRFAVEGRGKFTTWLVAVIRRLCVDEFRARYGRPQSSGEPQWQAERRTLIDLVGDELALERLESIGELPDDALVAKELRDALGEALSELDPKQRLILKLRFEDDVSVPEIARMLGMPSAFRLYRQIDKLLAELRRSLMAAGVRASES